MARALNVVVVYADQWRAQTMGYAGCGEVRTPNLDQFAGEAVNCRQAVSGTPVCTPARASLLTGLYPHRHGLFLNDVGLDPGLPTLGKVFGAAGYRTGWVGKWHVDGHGRYAFIPRERRQGFEYFRALECTHDYNHSRYYDNDDPTQRVWEGYDALAQTEDFIGWLRRGDGRPFLGVLSWGPPHSPFLTAPPEYRAMYEGMPIAVPENVSADQRAGFIQNARGYYAHCTALDDAFGRVLRALARTGEAERTVVLFLSDHGEFLGSHGLWDKQGPWDESVRVPFLLRAPGLLKAGINDVMIDHPDILPTLCGLLGMRGPEGMQGRDLSGHLRRGTVPDGDGALLAAYHMFGNWPRIGEKCEPLYRAREYRGVRTARHTYVESHEGAWLLYDNGEDPGQMRNLVGKESARRIQAELAAMLRWRLAGVGDEFGSGWDMVRKWGYQVEKNGTVPITDWAG